MIILELITPTKVESNPNEWKRQSTSTENIDNCTIPVLYREKYQNLQIIFQQFLGKLKKNEHAVLCDVSILI